MSKPFNYSKWDNIELSDDESDLHPNIDKDSWFRLKHRTRLEREEKEDQEIKENDSKTQVDSGRVKVIEARLETIRSGKGGEDAEFEDTDALEEESKELKEKIAIREKRKMEILERRKWNIDNICVVKEEKTMVNNKVTKSLVAADTDGEILKKNEEESNNNETVSASTITSSTTSNKAPSTLPKAPQENVVVEPSPPRALDRFSAIAYNDYAQTYEDILETYSEIADIEATKEYLFKHCDVLLHEHAQSYMLLSSLEDEMNRKYKRMELVCRQSQILTNIQELGQSMRRDPREVILPFFVRIQQGEYFAGFMKTVEDFKKKIKERAIVKRKEMDAEREAERQAQMAEALRNSAKEIGAELDPYEVLMGLPQPLREAFESQDIAELQKVLGEMDPKEAKKCMKQCVDSGLWVPSNKSIFEEEETEDKTEEES